MGAPVINPLHILDSYRKSDGVIIVCQNNDKKAIEIAAINDEAARIVGLNNDQAVGKPLESILPERVSSTISEYVEFDDDTHDLLAVLGKMRNFALKDANGQEREFKLRTIRGEAIDSNPWFHLVLVDEEKQRRKEAFRQVLKENFKGHEILDDYSGLPNRVSIIKDLELVVYYVRDKDISASFSIIDINNYDSLMKEYGAAVCRQLYRHIGQLCKLKLRTEDTVGTLTERSLAIILIDASQESARMVLNRLRWAIGVSPIELPKKGDLVAQVNVSFCQVDGRIRETEILEKCEAFMVEQRRQVSNNVRLVVTHERREKVQPDRRKASVPVAMERRKRDRRKG